MGHTAPGRKLYAIGGSKEAAEVAGIPIFRYRVLAFSLCGAIAGLAGALVASRVGSANTTAGQGYFLQSYAAVFIGCTVSKSGVPCVVGTLIGAAVLAVLSQRSDHFADAKLYAEHHYRRNYHTCCCDPEDRCRKKLTVRSMNRHGLTGPENVLKYCKLNDLRG